MSCLKNIPKIRLKLSFGVRLCASSSNYQKAKKQLLDARKQIERIVRTTMWLFCGIFYAAHDASDNPLSESISPFVIVGAETIKEKLKQVK